MLTSGRFRRSLGAALLFAVASPAAAARQPADQVKPRIRLLATPSVGFTPVTVVLTGQLTGVEADDPNYCHAAVTWVTIEPGQTEQSAGTVREDPVCRHAEEETRVVTSYTRAIDLYRPGPYLFRIRIEGKDRKRIQSGYVKVEVLRVQ